MPCYNNNVVRDVSRILEKGKIQNTMKKAKPILIVILLICFAGLILFAVSNNGMPLPKINPLPKQWGNPEPPPEQAEPDGGVLGSPEQGW
jgi:hypothetical protein